jgi:ABC-2 type transport system ATP-binding protein
MTTQEPLADTSGPPIVAATSLTKRYGELVAVDAIDLHVNAGDVYGLLGPNGAGKTTFMRMLFGLIRPDGGTIAIAGVPVQPVPVDALTGVAGFVETPRFYPYLSARKNLELLARLDGNGGRARIDDALDVVELTERAHSKVREFSYGMVQRLGVAAALMREPRLLVLDEPTNGLDPAGIRDMRRLIRRLADSGLTVLLSSHHMDEVDQMCTRVAIMRRGQLAFNGSMEELRDRAGRATRHLTTTDDATALAICEATPGVVAATREGSLIAFDADDETVERLSRELVAGGLAIRLLHAPTSALETLFFRLTDSEAADAEEAAA